MGYRIELKQLIKNVMNLSSEESVFVEWHLLQGLSLRQFCGLLKDSAASTRSAQYHPIHKHPSEELC